MKRKKLVTILIQESILRKQLDDLLTLARHQLAEAVLREEALQRRVVELERKLAEVRP